MPSGVAVHTPLVLTAWRLCAASVLAALVAVTSGNNKMVVVFWFDIVFHSLTKNNGSCRDSYGDSCGSCCGCNGGQYSMYDLIRGHCIWIYWCVVVVHSGFTPF